jgi:hypothetical protein
MAVIGVDAGASKTAGLLLEGESILERRRFPTDASSTAGVEKGLTETCATLLEIASSKGLKVEAVGLGIAGFIDHACGVVIDAPNQPLRNYPVRDILEAGFGLPVRGENDANAWALAEALLKAIGEYHLPVTAFDRLLEARIFDLYDDAMPDMASFEAWTTSDSFRQAHSRRPPAEMFRGPSTREIREVVSDSSHDVAPDSAA